MHTTDSIWHQCAAQLKEGGQTNGQRLSASERWALYVLTLCSTASDVPTLGEWAKVVFGTIRNDYDRLVHLSFGLLLAYPQFECILRAGKLKRSWALWLSPVLILGYGAGYEIIEAAAATLLTPDAGEAFLGLQGDPWDTHKDMFMAFAGAVITMVITAALSKKDRAREIR